MTKNTKIVLISGAAILTGLFLYNRYFSAEAKSNAEGRRRRNRPGRPMISYGRPGAGRAGTFTLRCPGVPGTCDDSCANIGGQVETINGYEYCVNATSSSWPAGTVAQTRR